MHLQWLKVIAVCIGMQVQDFSSRVSILLVFVSHHLQQDSPQTPLV